MCGCESNNAFISPLVNRRSDVKDRVTHLQVIIHCMPQQDPPFNQFGHLLLDLFKGHCVHHVLRPDSRPLRAVVNDSFALFHEDVQKGVTVVVDEGNAGE